MSKYNNSSNKFKDWTNKKLKEEAINYHSAIHEIECFGTRDLRTYDGIMNEINKRGIKWSQKLVF